MAIHCACCSLGPQTWEWLHLYAAGMPVDPNPVPFLDEPNYLCGFKAGLYPALHTISGPEAFP